MGTPLVTYLQDPQSGADVDMAVNLLLSPLKRNTYLHSSEVHSSHENGSVSEAHIAQPTSSFNAMEDDTESEEEMIAMPFHLSITDERGLTLSRIESDSPIICGQSLKVMLDWTDKDHEMYNFSYLMDLPEVCKTSFTAKKTRQEAISLFSCLEAFLKEEPLGPDDMW